MMLPHADRPAVVRSPAFTRQGIPAQGVLKTDNLVAIMSSRPGVPDPYDGIPAVHLGPQQHSSANPPIREDFNGMAEAYPTGRGSRP